ncbi:MAG: DoxX family membrane protein [Acidobacteria bacterium]|nr:DoxX family membrane protein [Acidobacteriota bacterium]
MTELTRFGPPQTNSFSRPLSLILLALRLLVGWHLLYEGLAKLLTPGWTSAPYLMLSRGVFPSFFHFLGSSPSLLRAVDFANIWGLILIGLALMLGCLTRFASASGIILLALYYMAQPPWIRMDYRVPLEGHYLVVDKNMVEMFTLLVFLILPSSVLWGLDRFLARHKAAKAATPDTPPADQPPAPPETSLARRRTLEDLVALPFLGALGYFAHKKYEWESTHAITGATIKLKDLGLKDLKGELPLGTLGKTKVSRVILGGNLIGGWAHSRDLIYTSSLFKAYNTDRKVFETFELAERAGVNTFCVVNAQMPLFNKYRELTGGRMQTLCQVYPTAEDLTTDINKAVDYGVTLMYVQGAHAERLVKNGKIDLLGKALDHMKRQGYLAGVGAHAISVPVECEKAGLNPDYYMKTFHHDKYWSAHPRENRIEYSVDTERLPDHNQFHDNMFDLFPDKTTEFMQTVKRPWIAFKVLAGGAITPQDGFKFAFENGADFVCVGMFDFQIVEDVNIALDVLSNLKSRPRPWYA